MRRISLFILVFFSSCVTLAPEAERVRLSADVAGCTMLGVVQSTPPYVGPNDGVQQLRNGAAALGADTLFLTAHGALRGKSGVAYRCAR